MAAVVQREPRDMRDFTVKLREQTVRRNAHQFRSTYKILPSNAGGRMDSPYTKKTFIIYAGAERHLPVITKLAFVPSDCQRQATQHRFPGLR